MASSDIELLARRHAQIILTGNLFSIDPASGGTSLPGWAAFKKSKLIQADVIGIPAGPIQDRLRSLTPTYWSSSASGAARLTSTCAGVSACVSRRVAR
jgi:hypothetical protein